MDVTTLGVGVDTSKVSAALNLLDQLATKGKNVQSILANLGSGGGGATSAVSGLTRVEQTLAQIALEGQRASTILTGIAGDLSKIASAAGSVASQTAKDPFAGWGSSLKALLGAGIAGYGIKELTDSFISSADTVQLLDARLKAATQTQQQYATAVQNVYQITDESHTQLEATGQIYARLTRSLTDLGATQNQVKQITQASSDALRLSGANTEEAAAAMLQLSQAFQSGRLQGDEFRSIAENAPGILKAVADELGVTTGALKQMSTQGKITSDVLGNALIDASEKLRDETQGLGVTVGQAWQDIKNSWTEAVGSANTTTGATKDLVDQLEKFAQYLKSDDFKTALTDTISTVATLASWLGKGADAVRGVATWAAFKQTGFVDPSGSDSQRASQIQDLTDQQAEAQKNFDALNDKASQWLEPERYKDAANALAQINQQLAAAKKQEADIIAQRKQNQTSALFAGVTGSAETYDAPLVNTTPPKAKKLHPSNRTGTLADEFNVDTLNDSNTALNKYRDEIRQITEAREADIKSGQNQTLVQQNVNTAVQGALTAYENARTAGIEKYNQATQDMLGKALSPAADALAKFNTQMAQNSKALEDGVIDTEAYTKRAAALAQQYDTSIDDIQTKNDKLNQYEVQAYRTIQSGLSQFLDSLVDGSNDSFKTIADNFLKTIYKMVAQAQAANLAQYLIGSPNNKGGIGGLLGTVVDAAGRAIGLGDVAWASNPSTAIPSVAGNIDQQVRNDYSSGSILNFRKGGVMWAAKGTVTSTHRTMTAGDGTTINYGEAGPEGVLPLTKTNDGTLGVQATGAQPPVVNVNIIGGPANPKVTQQQNGNGGFDINVMYDQIESRIGSNIANGRGSTHDAIQNRFGLNTAANLRN